MAHAEAQAAVLAVGGVVVGYVVNAALVYLHDSGRFRRDQRARLMDEERLAYARYFAALEDVADLPAQNLSQKDRSSLQADAWRRANDAICMIDILAPQEICDVAAAAWDVAELPTSDPARIVAIEALTTAVRQRFGAGTAIWRQYRAPD